MQSLCIKCCCDDFLASSFGPWRGLPFSPAALVDSTPEKLLIQWTPVPYWQHNAKHMLLHLDGPWHFVLCNTERKRRKITEQRKHGSHVGCQGSDVHLCLGRGQLLRQEQETLARNVINSDVLGSCRLFSPSGKITNKLVDVWFSPSVLRALKVRILWRSSVLYSLH